jgi:adenylate cyclase
VAEPTSRVVALRPAPQAPFLPLDAGDGAALADAPAGLASALTHQLRLWLRLINLLAAATTYVFIAFVVPLPGGVPLAGDRIVDLVVTVAAVGVCWLMCEAWERRTFAPVRRWLDERREPTSDEVTRTLRLPVYTTGHALAVWTAGGLGVGVLDAVIGRSVVGAVLGAAMIVLGGLVASAVSYFAAELIMRPAIAAALRHNPPERPVLPGIATRIYLAWEFGTAVAVGGAVVVAIAYLAGAGISAQRMAATVIFLGAVASTVGLATLLAATRSVADPVRAVRKAMARVEAGETDVAVPVDDGSEVGLLQAGFNRMVAGLRERDRVRDLFGRHVGEEVARSALDRGLGLGGELRGAAVMFVDVIGSTSFAATSNPRDVVRSLNRFFAVVVEVVTLHGGWVNKFEGDAALCVFGAPTDHPESAGAALASAREIQRRLEGDSGGLKAGIGLSCGTVVAGNIGAARRFEYTVIGDPVNEAARLTELAKNNPSRILASEAIVRRAREEEARRWELREPVQLRGRREPTRVAVPA